MYYGKSGADFGHEPAAEGHKLEVGSRLNCKSDKRSPKRSSWAWAVEKGHYDWMDSHTPVARHD